MRKRGVQVAAVVGLGLLWVAAGEGDNLKLKNVEVVGSAEHARVVLDVDGAVTHRTFTLKNPDRVVVDLVGAVNTVQSPVPVGPLCPIERLRVSQFKSAPEPVVRIVADLRQAVRFSVEAQDEDLVLVVGEGAVPAPSAAAVSDAVVEPVATSEDAAPTADFVMAPVTPEPSQPVEPVVATPATDATAETSSETVAVSAVVGPATPEPVAAPATTEWSTTLVADNATASPQVEAAPAATVEVRQSSGEDTSPAAPPGGVELVPTGSDRRINLDIQAADIHTVLRTLAEYSGRNIIAGKEVEGEVTARLYDTPWQDALNSILRSHGFGYIEENGILRVGVLQKLRTEDLEEAAAERKKDELLPIETQVVKLQFADAEELKPALSDMMTQRGKLQVDSRTNALIVSDIPSSVVKVAAMAVDLDSRTPQVEITSRLVDLSLEDSKNLGITWSANNIQPAGSPVTISGGVAAPTTGPVAALSIGSVQSWGQLQATLDALARNKKANVVSNPNITTVNNREAKILVGQKIPLIVADQAGNAITQLTKIGIQMAVIPHVNSDKTITMDMHTEVSELSSQATVQGGVIIQTSEADTRVLVDNGETAVIGGLVRDVKSHTYTGVPVLQNLPLLGWFFRNTNEEMAKRELIIFVTPHLIEPGERRPAPELQLD